jgi:Uma2 family endonuclease
MLKLPINKAETGANMRAIQSDYLTVDEYFRLSERDNDKLEYLDGEIIAMSGASPSHNIITSNLNRVIGNHLVERPCLIYSSDMRVKLNQRAYIYPDVSVVCGEPRYYHHQRDSVAILENPTLVIEVLSPSTERIDRGRKSIYYRRLPSLQEYLLVSQDEPHVEHYVRQEDGTWSLNEISDLAGEIYLGSIECTLTLRDIYLKVQFSPPEL